MDREGVDVSVVLNIGWSSHELCLESNDYLLEMAARYPGRLVPFCAVQPRAGEAALRELERCAHGGARGVGELRPDRQGFDLGDESVMEPLVAALVENNLIWLSHASEPVGHAYPGKGGLTPDRLYQFIVQHPRLTVVLAHWGGGLPFYALMPKVAQALERVYFDTAASPWLYRSQVFRIAADLVGADKILLGSDYPLLPPQRIIEEARASGLSQSEMARILGGNARGLLGLGPGEG